VRPPVVLTIAGSDPSGGAGLQADLRTCTALNVYAGAVPTCITVQDTCGVRRVEPLASALVGEQIDAVLSDLEPQVIKLGLLPTAAIVARVGVSLAAHRSIPVVLDPVLVATSGDALASEDTLAALRALLPRAALVTPNLAEAARLSGRAVVAEDDMVTAARAILLHGPGAVLVKGGHLAGDAVDVLLAANGEPRRLRAPRIAGPAIRGTGCALSAAIAARLARGDPLDEAVRAAKLWLHRRIATAAKLGRGAAVLLP
jgi:hydroxymethylpyrimidine/phosphomethylpyrimidine kinase